MLQVWAEDRERPGRQHPLGACSNGAFIQALEALEAFRKFDFSDGVGTFHEFDLRVMGCTLSTNST